MGKYCYKNHFHLVYEPSSIVYHYHGIHHDEFNRAQSIINIIEILIRKRI